MPTMSASRRREVAKQEYNAFVAECPTRQFLDAISDKWVCLVVNALGDGPLRHGEIARTVAGASQKMLTKTLRTLERDGMVRRTVTPSVPVRVDYELTDLGRDLAPLMHSVKTWAETHMERVAHARRTYDETNSSADPRA